MRAKLLKETLTSLWNKQNLRPVVIEGAPGGGKTSIVQQVASDLNIGYIEKHLPTMLVEDFGVPDIINKSADGTFSYTLPDWYPAESRTDIPEVGVLCFDDRNQGDNALQKTLANIMQARTLHGVPLKKGWWVISTGNRQSDRAGSNRVLSHVRGRETILELETHIDDFTSYAISQGTPPEVVSFVHFRTNLLHDFDPQRDQNPSPRSWLEGVGRIIGSVPSEAEYECFKGAVGEGAAAEFVGFLNIHRKLPNPDTILRSPTTADLPTDSATCYALCGALGERATKENFKNLVTYANRFEGINKADLSVLMITYAVRKNGDLFETEAFINWSDKHQDVLF